MKKLIFSFLLLSTFCLGHTQNHIVDSLKQQLTNAKDDTSRILALSAFADYYGFLQFDSSVTYAHKVIALSKQVSYMNGLVVGYRALYFAYNCQGNYPRALEATLEGQRVAEQIKKERPNA